MSFSREVTREVSAEATDRSQDLVPNRAEGGKPFLLRTFQAGRIREGPVQALFLRREDGAGFRSLRITDRDDVVKTLSGGVEVKDAPCLFPADIYAVILCKQFDDQGVE